MKKTVIGLMSLLWMNYSLADAFEEGKVSTIIVETTFVSFWLAAEDDNSECSDSRGRWTVSIDDPLFKEKYSTILAAATSNRAVRLRHLAGTHCGPFGGNRIYYVHVKY